MTKRVLDFYHFAQDLKEQLQPHFSVDTAYPGTDYVRPTSGHCAAVAFIVRQLKGGDFVSARYNEQSHWFNRISGVEIDLTGDQYDPPPVRLGLEGTLYADARFRWPSEMQEETRSRARILAKRAGLDIGED